MKHLIIYAHPNPASFNKAILDTAVEVSKAQGHEVVVRDLYALNFNPVLSGSDIGAMRSGQIPADIKAEQEFVAWADLITFVYPVWWIGMPAIVKGYIDRIYSYGFAYAVEATGLKKLLTGKKALIINTTGSANEILEGAGFLDAMNKATNFGIFDFCGIQVLEHQYYGGIPTSSAEQRSAYLEDLKSLIAKTLVPAHFEEVAK